MDEILHYPIPFLEEITEAQIEYLKEKNKVQEAAMKNQQ